MRIIRVFPRRTIATPTGETVRAGNDRDRGLPELWDEADAVEVSVAFTWDLPAAERLAAEWERVAPVTIGGPGTGQPGGDFVAGQYVRPGITITSRGCPNRCGFCDVWRREGNVRELPIVDGHIVQDDNLLACSEGHVRAVLEMLDRQTKRAKFAGGFEAARLKDWHVGLLAGLRPRPDVFFAFDEPDDWEPLVVAASKLWEAGFTKPAHRVQCYVLIGQPGDTIGDATHRLMARKGLA